MGSERISEHKTFLQERDRIDFLIQQGYKITNITETLNGDFVQFAKEEEEETLQIINPDARKYFSTILIRQIKEGV